MFWAKLTGYIVFIQLNNPMKEMVNGCLNQYKITPLTAAIVKLIVSGEIQIILTDAKNQ